LSLHAQSVARPRWRDKERREARRDGG